MGIAFTNGPIVYRTMRGDSVANLLADLHDALTAASWSPSAMTGGYRYTVSSPQGLACSVWVYDAGDGHVTVQFLSLDETLPGYAHKLAVSATYNSIGYKILANRCQIFVALHGITHETISIFERNYAVAGGIPYIPLDLTGECSDSGGSDTASQAFWSCGQVNNEEFRVSRFCSGIFTTCWGTTLTIASGTPSYTPANGALQLYPLTMTEDVDVWFRTLPRVVKYGSGDPLHLDPYIGWGFAIRGQLWDAFLLSRDTTLEETKTTSEPDALGVMHSGSWLAWNYGLFLGGRGGGGTYFATLYLLTGELGGGGAGSVVNYAY